MVGGDGPDPAQPVGGEQDRRDGLEAEGPTVTCRCGHPTPGAAGDQDQGDARERPDHPVSKDVARRDVPEELPEGWRDAPEGKGADRVEESPLHRRSLAAPTGKCDLRTAKRRPRLLANRPGGVRARRCTRTCSCHSTAVTGHRRCCTPRRPWPAPSTPRLSSSAPRRRWRRSTSTPSTPPTWWPSARRLTSPRPSNASATTCRSPSSCSQAQAGRLTPTHGAATSWSSDRQAPRRTTSAVARCSSIAAAPLAMPTPGRPPPSSWDSATPPPTTSRRRFPSATDRS